MDIKGIIHIGAHYGEEIEEYLNNGIQNIILFEPLSENFDILSEKVKDLNANIEGHQVALGSKTDTLTMYVSDNEKQSSSLLKPKVHLTHHPNVKFPSTEEVEVHLLDEYDCKDYNFINMDVQGYELEVLKGSSKTLNFVDYILCEVNRAELYKGCPMVEEIDSYLSQFGFKRHVTSWDGYTWGDALYVKEST